MHIPDGFLSPPVWVGAVSVSAPSVAVLARRAQGRLDQGRIPLMGVLGAFVFAAQMINFPVGAGASGHLVGAALLTAVLGPSAASVTLTAILCVQALVFQDGGVLALGANVFNMALAGVLAAWWPWKALGDTRPRAAAALAGFLSVFVSALMCLGELAISGTRLPPAALSLSLGVFLVTAILEGVITAAVLSALGGMNRGWLRQPEAGGRRALALLGAAALLLGCVGFVLASSLPDGLERLAGLAGLQGREWTLVHAPFSDYEASFAASPWLRKATAGLAGLALVAGACLAAGRWITRPRST
jgi:cobalt/nickel transport system permease protein